MTFKEIIQGETYYIVRNTTSGVIMEKVVVKAKFYGMNAVLVVDENERERKLYQNSLEDLLTKDEAMEKYKQTKGNKPLSSAPNISGRWTYCWRCKADINRDSSLKCPDCGWNICPSCGSCKCDYTK